MLRLYLASDLKPLRNRINRYFAIYAFLFSIWSFRYYLGFSSAGNLTMFSNLRTLKNDSNHLIVNTQFSKICLLEEDNVELGIEGAFRFSDKQHDDLAFSKIPKSELSYIIHTWKLENDTPVPAVVIENEIPAKYDNVLESKYANYKWCYKYLFYGSTPMPCEYTQQYCQLKLDH